jgi:hypothetical protein
MQQKKTAKPTKKPEKATMKVKIKGTPEKVVSGLKAIIKK